MIVKAGNCKHCLPLDIKTMPSIQPLNTESGRAPQRDKSLRLVINPWSLQWNLFPAKYCDIILTWTEEGLTKKLCLNSWAVSFKISDSSLDFAEVFVQEKVPPYIYILYVPSRTWRSKDASKCPHQLIQSGHMFHMRYMNPSGHRSLRCQRRIF